MSKIKNRKPVNMLFIGIIVICIIVLINVLLRFQSNKRIEESYSELKEAVNIEKNINERQDYEFEKVYEEIVELNEKLMVDTVQLKKEFEALNYSDPRLTIEHITDSMNRIYFDESGDTVDIKANRFDARQPSLVTVYELNTALEGTGKEGFGEYYINAEMEYGVNAVFLLGISIQESGWGTSDIAAAKNNLFGYGADTENGENAVTFDSPEHSIMKVAEALSRDYLSEDGKYHNGYTIHDINKLYAGDNGWGDNITSIMERLNKKIVDQHNNNE